ncbi:hypothetical protein [Actinoplanes sp. URMC 104]|uniref:hypothetical protein n=1 Tax=Actinoplanes sp. URMC 104 TaxID=3423409 RepID=UPI003F1DB225
MTYQPSYTSLVAALRAQFPADDLRTLHLKFLLWKAMEGEGAVNDAQETLHGAVVDALNPEYDPGEDAHPAVRDWFASGARR